jgi:hypothetical protein
MESKLTHRHSPVLTLAVPIISLMTALVVGAINARILPADALWVCAAAFVVLAVLFLFPWISLIRDRLLSARTQGQVRAQYRQQILALRNALEPLSSPTSIYSAGNVLNRELTQKLLGVPCILAFQTSLSALLDRIEDLQRLAPHVSDVQLMSRIHSWLQTYLRICEQIGAEFRNGLKGSAIPPGHRDSLVRDWAEICERANALRNEYSRLAYGVRSVDPSAAVPDYLPQAASLP